jgi:hypothetical protein
VRKLRGHEIAIGAFAATAVWALIFVLTSDAASHYEICEPAKEGAKQAAKDCTSYNIISFLLREFGAHLDIIGAVITAFATAFIARYTFTLKQSTDRLWDAGERQLIHLTKSSEQQLRAYVGIESCEVITRDWGSTFTVEIRIKNTGATPARDVHHHVAADVFAPFGERIEFAPPGRNSGIIPLAPGMSHLLETPIAIGGPAGVPGIEASRRAIFTWGRVNYWDVFGREQHMMFRFRSGEPIRKHDGTVMRTVGWRMTAEDQGNSAS